MGYLKLLMGEYNMARGWVNIYNMYHFGVTVKIEMIIPLVLRNTWLVMFSLIFPAMGKDPSMFLTFAPAFASLMPSGN